MAVLEGKDLRHWDDYENVLDMELLAEALNAPTTNSEYVVRLVADLCRINRKMGEELCRHINRQQLAESLSCSKSHSGIDILLLDMVESSTTLAIELMELLGPNVLSQKLNESRDTRWSADCLANVDKVNHKLAVATCALLDSRLYANSLNLWKRLPWFRRGLRRYTG